MSKYIFHSEKTNTTCELCKKHDGKIFYDIKDIPQLPIHPNCRCWIETIETKTADGNIKCDCSDRFRVLENNLYNIVQNTNYMKDNLDKEILDCLIEIEDTNNHKISKDKKEKLYGLKKSAEELNKKSKILICDIDLLKEFSFDETYHTTEQCKSNEELKRYSKNTSKLCEELNNLSEEIKRVKENRKEILKDKRTKEKELEKLKQGKITGGAGSIEQRADFFEYGKNNIYVKINEKLNAKRPNTKELADIFLVRPKNAPKSANYRRLEPDYAETINSQYNLFGGNKEIGKNWTGFVYYQDSLLAIDVSHSKELQEQIRKHYDNSTKSFLTDKIEVSFSDGDLHLALGHATVLNPNINSDGYFHGILFDKYDFDLIYKLAYKNPFIYAANDYFWFLQERDRNRNFYILAPVVFKW